LVTIISKYLDDKLPRASGESGYNPNQSKIEKDRRGKMENNKEAKRRIEATKRERIPYLDLRGLKLTQIPQEVAELNWIRALSLSNNSISDLSLLASLKGLKKLALSHCQVEDLSPLSELKDLKFLFVRHNRIESLEPLRGLKALKKIVAHHNRITDLSALAALYNLSFLDLADNAIMDPGPLKGMPELKWLDLQGNAIDEKAMAALERMLPSIVVFNPTSKVC
jgi:Leucine-rich repeat (LRR) protein